MTAYFYIHTTQILNFYEIILLHTYISSQDFYSMKDFILYNSMEEFRISHNDFNKIPNSASM